MTPLWHDGPLAALPEGAAPVVWRVPDAGPTARHTLACALVARRAELSAGVVQLARSRAGAPRVANPPGWYIGLSQRGGRSLIAVAMRPIAVDREVVDGMAPLWDMLSAGEATALRKLDRSDQPRAWLRRWTIKEAHAKLIGEPRRIAPELIETSILDRVNASAVCEGRSRCWTRDTGDAIETVAMWDEAI
ncbi:4'-phosphopantetheinyl transferase superfamily protein [Sphingomonas sp. TREG-RG-20F-R18-01]|uniref:4'-phosphopantetheinyl transferase family protein n=1 Tax=Sphingomonas sp. TREG-RG-20F-R18-01 TaxID=2914982 RepID=UPI001F58E328|nr:4'-phosphopantetheinyl transferase superfamily protein [Sphingomonas sp. TREG-RG-20F-R18-01]